MHTTTRPPPAPFQNTAAASPSGATCGCMPTTPSSAARPATTVSRCSTSRSCAASRPRPPNSMRPPLRRLRLFRIRSPSTKPPGSSMSPGATPAPADSTWSTCRIRRTQFLRDASGRMVTSTRPSASSYEGPDTAHVGREMCFSSNEDSLTIVDVTNKSRSRPDLAHRIRRLRIHAPGLADPRPGAFPAERRAGRAQQRTQQLYLHLGPRGPRRPGADGPLRRGRPGDRPQPVRPRRLRLRVELPGRPEDPRRHRGGGGVLDRGRLLRHLPRGRRARVQRQLEQLSVLRER